MIGIGVAEGSGLFNSMIRALVLKAPKRLITGAIVFAGVLSHLASEAGYVILIPLGATIFYALGRHPMAGLAAAFCGVSGGFGANFLIGSIDPVLAGLTQSAANIINPDIKINAAVNFYFMFISAVMIVLAGTWITEKIVEPRLKNYEGNAEKIPVDDLTSYEKKGLKWAGLSLIVTIILLVFTIVPENGIFRNPVTKEILHSPFFDGIITGILVFFLVPGLVYGIAVKSIKNDKDFMKHIIKSMGTLSTYIVLVFFAAQFVYFFRYSNLGLIIAIDGAQFLKSIGLTGIPLLVAFVLVSAFINLFMGSASAKWAIMAPVFVPMFMLLGYHPALTQAAFRIGDSVTNLVTPMMSYFALIVAFAQKYDEKYGIGTIISTMIPYTILLTVFWIILLILWMLVGLPLGPDGPLFLAN
jgi:aminobenzoyl-glutamate transport protein